jgi:hypothetical protein
MAAASTLIPGLTIAEDTAAATSPRRRWRASTTAVEGARPMQLFNSMTKKKEVFVPRVEGKVGMYVWGVTPYDSSHLGRARAYDSSHLGRARAYDSSHLGRARAYVALTETGIRLIRLIS